MFTEVEASRVICGLFTDLRELQTNHHAQIHPHSQRLVCLQRSEETSSIKASFKFTSTGCYLLLLQQRAVKPVEVKLHNDREGNWIRGLNQPAGRLMEQIHVLDKYCVTLNFDLSITEWEKWISWHAVWCERLCDGLTTRRMKLLWLIS